MKEAGSGEKLAPVDIDKALELTGHRWFHWMLLVIGGLSFLGSGFEFTLQGYIQPLAQCDLELTTAKMSVITAGFIASSVLSSLIWGVTADAIGRKTVLVLGVTAEGVCTVAASLAPTSDVFIAIRCIGGFMVGSGLTVIITYVGEFCPDIKRPRNVCLIGTAWTLTWLLMPGMAALIIPYSWQLNLGFVVYKPWRLFIALVGAINIISGLLIALFLPESPKYYLSRGMEKEALEILKNMYAHNFRKTPEEFSVQKLTMGNMSFDDDSSNVPSKTFRSLCTEMVLQMQLLMRPPLLWNSFLCSAVYICSMSGYYSLGLWLPEFFQKLDVYVNEHPNATSSLCSVISSKNSSAHSSLLIDCDSDHVEFGLFTNTFILGAACSIASIFMIYAAATIRTKYIIAASLGISGACVVSLYFSTAKWLTTTLSAVFLSCASVAVAAHHSCAINLFPTHVRGMGVCISLIFGRTFAAISNLLFGQLIDDYCEIPIFLVVGFTIAGVVLSAILPKSSQKALE